MVSSSFSDHAWLRKAFITLFTFLGRVLRGKSISFPISLYCIIMSNSQGGKLLRFSQFLLNYESFPVENFTRLGIHYYKKLLPPKYSCQIFIFALTTKVFPLDCFDIYGTSSKGCTMLLNRCIAMFSCFSASLFEKLNSRSSLE